MPDLLLELFSEEIPARMQAAAVRELADRLAAKLREARLAFGEIERFVTPRRIAVRIAGLPDTQPDQTIEKKGPKLGAPQGAIDGFCRSSGVPFEQLEQREIKGETFYFASQQQRGQPAITALTPLIEAVLKEFPWPKSMRWGAGDLRWVRPLRRILCLLDREIVPVSFGPIRSANLTEGHRFLSPGEIVIAHPGDYAAKLEAARVIADPAKRRAKIERDAAALAQAHGGEVRADGELLDEVTGLVEWPVALMGSFDPAYLALPPEVLVLEMRHHQKYFAVQKPGGSLLDRFLVIANITAEDDGEAIVRGNERVLRARLEDGRFFWEQDKKTPLADWAAKLDGMLFHAKLGSMAEKAARISSLAAAIALAIGADAALARRAASLAKADLTTGMVGEFPELQGVMGRYYAIAQGEPAAIADAIRDHYKPAGADDNVPTDAVAVAVALADKLDTLAGMFAAGEKPTGSKDPFALRRAALGIIRIILENNLRISLGDLLTKTLAGFASSPSQGEDRGGGRAVPLAPSESAETSYPHPASPLKGEERETLILELLAFFADRLKVILKDQGVRHDVVSAVVARQEDDLVRLVERARALQDFLGSDDGAQLLAAYKRASNIVAKEEKKDGVRYADAPEKALFAEEAETRLHAALESAQREFAMQFAAEHYAAAMQAIVPLRRPVDRFFEEVTVNADDAKVRINRLNLLSAIRAMLDQIASFEKIEG